MQIYSTNISEERGIYYGNQCKNLSYESKSYNESEIRNKDMT